MPTMLPSTGGPCVDSAPMSLNRSLIDEILDLVVITIVQDFQGFATSLLHRFALADKTANSAWHLRLLVLPEISAGPSVSSDATYW